jgi:membrane protease YdiL (CAAX protease family)
MLKQHPFGVYYFWTCAIPLGIVLTLLYFPAPFYAGHDGPFEFNQLLKETVASSGVVLRGGALGPLLRSVSDEPLLVFLVLASAIPAVVAVVLAPLTFGRKGLIRLIGRLRPWLNEVRSVEGLRTWGLAILLLMATHLLTYAIRYAMGAEVRAHLSWNQQLFSLAFFWLLLEAMFLNQGGLLEELGFRGYALPLLQEEMSSPLAATVVLGVCWALWHIPRDLLFETPQTLGIPVYLGVFFPLFAIWCLAGSILMTYFFNRTGGSALIAIAVHGILNDSASFSGIVNTDDLIVTMGTRTLALVIAASLILHFAGANLGARPNPRPGVDRYRAGGASDT